MARLITKLCAILRHRNSGLDPTDEFNRPQSFTSASVFIPSITGNAWVRNQRRGFWCPGAKALDHQYPQCWVMSIYCIRPVSCKNVTFTANNWKLKLQFWKNYPVVYGLIGNRRNIYDMVRNRLCVFTFGNWPWVINMGTDVRICC